MIKRKKLISVLLSAILVLTCIPFSSFAVDTCAHEWNEGVTVSDATCVQDGSITYTCKLCNETRTEILTALDHDFDDAIEENVTTVPASCTADGSKTVKCSRCDETKVSVIQKTGHLEYSDPVWTWEGDENGATAVATFTCLKGDDDQTPEVTVTGEITTPPTCTETGTLTYTGKTTFRDVEYTSTFNVTIPATTHLEYSAPVWTWTADLESGSAVATFTCLKGDDDQTPEVTVSSKVTLAPTCTEDGTLTYTGKTTFRDVEYTSTFNVTIPATTHLEYSAPVWTWEGDENGATAVAAFTCLENDDVQTPEVTVTGEITTPPTCTETGIKTYTATVLFRGTEYTDTYDVVASATGHVEYAEPEWIWTADLESGNAVATFTCLKGDDEQTPEVAVSSEITLAPTCTEDGTLTYTGKTTFRDVEYTSTFNVTIPATTHLEYSDPVWTWEGDENGATAVAAFTCLENDDVQTPEVTVTGEITTPPTCTETGIKTYTATVSFRGTEYTDTYDVVASATGHVEYAEPEWTWTADLKSGSAVATFTCLEGDDDQTPEVTVSSKVTLAPTCTKDGTLTYTGKTTFRDVEYTNTFNVTIPATTHLEYSAPVWTWEGDENGATAVAAFTCLENDDVQTPEVTVTGEITTPPTCTETGIKTYTATVSFRGTEYTDTYDVVASATGHVEYAEPEWIWKESMRGVVSVNVSFTCLKNDDTQITEISLTSEITTEPTCVLTGIRTYTAVTTFRGVEYVSTYDQIVAANGHSKLVTVKPKVATCTEPGHTAEVVCTVCNEVLNPCETVPATGHNTYARIKAKAATCTEDGRTAELKCLTCGAITQVSETIPAIGHNYQVSKVVPVACTTDGYTVYTCLNCKDSYNAEIVPHPGHDFDVQVVEANCTEGGYTTYTCKTCAYTYTDFVVPPLGHDYIVHLARPSTCIEKGWDEYETCSRCEYSTFRELDFSGHVDANYDGKCDVCSLRLNCGHICHQDNFIGKLIRFFYSLSAKLTGQDKKCCSDMEYLF